jgi:hypothetical protein
MSDTAWFALLFGGFFVVRCIAATFFFLMILPVGVRCPHCDAVTVRIQSRGWNLLMPWFRTSWCYECGWEGLLRHCEPAPTHALDAGAVPPASARDREAHGSS